MGCETLEQFYQMHMKMLVPLHLQMSQTEMVTTIANKLNKSMKATLHDCHSTLISCILPCINENSSADVTRSARRMKSFIEMHVPEGALNDLLVNSLDEVIFNMINLIYDPEELARLYPDKRVLNYEKSLFSFDTETVMEAFQKLSPEPGTPLLSYVAIEKPCVIQKVMLMLLEEVDLAVTYEDKITSFFKYITFIGMLSSKAIQGKSFRRVNTFIIREVIYTLVLLIRKDEGDVITVMACRCLKKFADHFLLDFNRIFGEFLPVITTVMVPLVKAGHKDAFDVLRFLICENYEKLRCAIDLLDPFPSEDVFKDINNLMECRWNNKRLEDVIRHFIAAGNNKNSGSRVEGLKHMHKILANQKEMLTVMYSDLKAMRGFSEDCKKSLLHQLICMLVQLTSDQSSEVSLLFILTLLKMWIFSKGSPTQN